MTDYAELRRLAEVAFEPEEVFILLDTLEAQQERIADLEKAAREYEAQRDEAEAKLWRLEQAEERIAEMEEDLIAVRECHRRSHLTDGFAERCEQKIKERNERHAS